MHGDSLLMLTTKVVSNKKPPLLSDSESGGSTSLHTILDITGIKTPEFQETRSIINPYYNQERKRIFLDKDYDNWQ